MGDRKDPKAGRPEGDDEETSPAAEREQSSSYYYDDSTGYETYDPDLENDEEPDLD